MQVELRELINKAGEFEVRYSEVQKESNARCKEAEESLLKITQLQDSIDRYSLKK